MITTQELLEQIRDKQVKLASDWSDQAETNIKYCNIKDERLKKKKNSLPLGTQSSSETTASPSLVSSPFTSSSLSPNGDIAALVSLQDGTTSSLADASQEVVKATPISAVSSGPEVHYAKVSVKHPAKNTRRRKINLDFNVVDSNKMNKLTFATTDKFWEWHRDIKAAHANVLLTEEDWDWYEKIVVDYQKIKTAMPNITITIGKGCVRAQSKPVRRTACIYTGTEVAMYIGDWHHNFELESIMSGPGQKYFDSHGEYRSSRTGYVDLTWE
jgi:hypothetical protein